MRRNTLFSGLAALLALASISASSQADIVTRPIYGVVTEAGSGVPGVFVGSPVTGSYSYDDAVFVNTLFFGPVNLLSAFSLSIGSNPYTFGLADVDMFGIPAFRLPPLSTPTTDWLGIHFTQSSLESFMGTTGIGPSNDLFGDGVNPEILKTGLINDPAHTVTFAFVAGVPEPGSLALFASMGLAGSAFLRRRRQRARGRA